jgi:hypothetical protein
MLYIFYYYIKFLIMIFIFFQNDQYSLNWLKNKKNSLYTF